MAGTRRKSHDLELINRRELIRQISLMKSERNRGLAAFIYLTGARISEIVGTKKKIKGQIVEVKPLTKESVEIMGDDDLILVHSVACLKRRDNIPKRTIPIVISKEKELVSIFYTYYSKLKDGSVLFPITRQRAWQIINKEMGIYTHYLIHERCTHLVTYNNFTDLDLKQYRGWSNTMPASIYTHLNFRDIAAKMKGT